MIPYAGPIVAGTAISLIALFTQGIGHGVACAIYFIVYGLLEGNVLAPLIFRRTVNVNPLVVTLSILFLGEIAGIMGAIIAVPVVATLQIVLREVLRIRRERLQLAREATGQPFARSSLRRPTEPRRSGPANVSANRNADATAANAAFTPSAQAAPQLSHTKPVPMPAGSAAAPTRP